MGFSRLGGIPGVSNRRLFVEQKISEALAELRRRNVKQDYCSRCGSDDWYVEESGAKFRPEFSKRQSRHDCAGSEFQRRRKAPLEEIRSASSHAGDSDYTVGTVSRMALDWSAIWTRVFRLIDTQGSPSYYSGSRFIGAVQEIDPYFPGYTEYLEQRRKQGQSTTRRDWYKDIFMGFGEPERFKLVSSILNEVQSSNVDLCVEIRTMMSGGVLAPSASVPEYAWNGDRLNEYLNGMDAAISAGDYERTVTMAYTCFEGFLGAFLRAKRPGQTSYPNEIIALSKEVCEHLKAINKDYPDEVLNLIKHSAHAVDKARNRFSESHFGGEAGLWLATYVRDQVNTQIRLLLHFM